MVHASEKNSCDEVMGIRFRRGAGRLWSPQSPRNGLLTERSRAVEPRRAVDRAAALVRVRALLLEGSGSSIRWWSSSDPGQVLFFSAAPQASPRSGEEGEAHLRGLWLSAATRAASCAQTGPTESLGSGQARCSCDSRVARRQVVSWEALAGPYPILQGRRAVRLP